MCEEIMTTLCGDEPVNVAWFGNHQGFLLMVTKNCQTGLGFSILGASKSVRLWIFIVSTLVCLWRSLLQWWCKFGAFWKVVGDSS